MVMVLDGALKDNKIILDRKQSIFKSTEFKKTKFYQEFPINESGFKVFSTTEGPKYVLFRYAMAASTLATIGVTRLTIDDKPLKDSITYTDGRPYYGFSGISVYKLESGSHKIRIETVTDNTIELEPDKFDF